MAKNARSRKQTSRKNSKKAAPAKVEEPVQETPVQETPVQDAAPAKAQAKPARKKSARKTPVKKQSSAKTVDEVQTEVNTEVPTDTETATATATGSKPVRSFKAQLPGSETYCGRFTGRTPYQAANKALSRYFRSTDEPETVVTFTIRESTRGSKNKVYTYEGQREELETPIEYTVGDGNTIVKHHKNRLRKVKKADVASA